MNIIIHIILHKVIDNKIMILELISLR